MSEEQKEAFEAVEKINNELFIKYNKKNSDDAYIDWIARMPIVSVTFADYMIFISIGLASELGDVPEIKVYNSECNDRIYYEKSDKYESYYMLIKRKFREIKRAINEIKI
jgi:hypothetical protein